MTSFWMGPTLENSRSPSSSLCTVLDSILSKIDETLSINPSAVFVFGVFYVHHKDWLNSFDGSDTPGEVSLP